MWVKTSTDLINLDHFKSIYWARDRSIDMWTLRGILAMDEGFEDEDSIQIEVYDKDIDVKAAYKHIYQCLQQGETLCILPTEGASKLD